MEIKVGIYKITNLINQHCYIGQSRNIFKRWSNHKVNAFNKNYKGYDYPLYKAFRKYGLKNFCFEILEECKISDLANKEFNYIQLFNPEYNQTINTSYNVVPQKLTFQEVQEIQFLLINDKRGVVSHCLLAKKYNVSKDTIRDINVGRTWKNDNFVYPLHYSKFDANKPTEMKQKHCVNTNEKKKNYSLPNISREKLKELIRTETFVSIGKMYLVSDNAIRKWCDKYNLPRTKKIINSYSDEEWKNI